MTQAGENKLDGQTDGRTASGPHGESEPTSDTLQAQVQALEKRVRELETVVDGEGIEWKPPAGTEPTRQ